jgi:hypothetical protein
MKKIATSPTSSETTTIPMGFTGESLPHGIHLCYIYTDGAERNRILSQLVEDGVQNGEKVAYFMDVIPSADMTGYLYASSMDRFGEAPQKHLSLATTKEMYYPTGTFVPEEMFERLGMFYRQSIDEGYSGARVVGEASWLVRGVPGSSRFMEYEALVNDILHKYPVNVICLYNAGLFERATLRDVLAVHPMIVIHGQVMKNPYYEKSWWLLNRCLGPDDEPTCARKKVNSSYKHYP